MKSFEGHQGEKERIAEQLRKHYEADEIIKGKYWQDGKGRAVGCIIHGKDHFLFEELFNIPEWYARLIDTIFEGLPNGEAKEFPLQAWLAIPEGVDITPVKWKFCAFLMKENIERVLTLQIPEELKKQVVDSIRGVLALHERTGETGLFDESAAAASESAAWSAARSAAWSASESAWSAAASESARSARSAAWSAAESAYIRYRDELLRLLKECAN